MSLLFPPPHRPRAKANKKPLSLYRVYIRAFGARILLGGFVKIVGDSSTFVPPLALAGAISYVTGIFYANGTTEYEYVSWT